MRSRRFAIPVLVFAAVLAAGDAAVLAYFERQRENEAQAEGDRIRGAVRAIVDRHVDAVRHLARDSGDDADASRHARRAESLAIVFPALVGTQRIDASGKPIVGAALSGYPEATVTGSRDTPATRSALAGTPAVDDPFPAPNGELVMAAWVPAEGGGAIGGLFQLDRVIWEAVDAAAGRDSPLSLADSRGREVSKRGEKSEATLRIPLALPGLNWTVSVRPPDRRGSRAVAASWAVVVLSAAMLAGFALSRRRFLADQARLEERAKKLETLAGVERRAHGRMVALLDSMPLGVVLVGPEGEWLTSNVAADKLLGGDSPVFLRADGSPYPPEQLPVKRALAQGGKVAVDDIFVKTEEGRKPLTAVASALDKTIGGAVVIYSDVTRQREWEETMRVRDFALTMKNKFAADLQDAKKEEDVMKVLRTTLDMALSFSDFHIFSSRHGDRLRLERSTSFKSEGGMEPPVLTDPGMCPVMTTCEPHDPLRNPEKVQPCLGRVSPGGVLCAPLMAGGKCYGAVHLELTPGPAPEQSRVDLALELIETASSHVNSIRLVEIIQQASLRDWLTGLYNRRHFDQTAPTLLAQSRRNTRPMAVLMIDIDHFKTFNDRHGHDAGDIVLREFGKTLQSSGRTSDVLVRYGGEEFAALLPETGPMQAKVAAERILERTRAMKLPIPGLERGQVTVSIGVAVYPENGETPEALVKAADNALYRAKKSGRNQVAIEEVKASL